MGTKNGRSGAMLFLAAAILSCLLLSGCPQQEAAAGAAGIYYVAPDGDDSASGEQSHPWATFERAMCDLAPGDLVLVRGGSYSQRLVIGVSGKKGNPITFAGYPGETPIIDGTGLTIQNGWGGLIEAVGKSFLTISGFTVQNSSAAAIFACDGRGLSVIGNTTKNSICSGIQAWGDTDLAITDNTVIDACLGGEGYQECISISGATGFAATGNEVIGGGMEGLDVKDGSSHGLVADNLLRDLPRVGIYIDAWDSDQSDIEVARNRSWNNKVGISVNSENGGVCGEVAIHDNDLACNLECGLWIGGGGVATAAHLVIGVEAWGNMIRDTRKGDGIRVGVVANGRTEDIDIHDNLVYRNGRAGIIVSDYRQDRTTESATMADVRIVNNTIVANGRDLVTDDGWGTGGIALLIAEATDLVVRNNLIADHPRFSIATDSTVVFGPATDRGFLAIDHNAATAFPANAYGINQTVGDDAATGTALFVDAAAADYRPAAGSSAIGAGASAGAPARDFAGALRPASGPCTAGAYEYVAE
jgi:hypothetical protein